MKKFTNVFESIKAGNDNPGNSYIKTGVSNHYTPIENILTNINNYFCARLSIVAMKGEDDVSIKLTSSKFTSEKAIDELLYMTLYNDAFSKANLYSYITAQGLPKVSKVNLGGGYWVVYFSPDDIATAAKHPDNSCGCGCDCPDCGCDCCCPVPCEAYDSLFDEFEITSIIKEDDEEEMEDVTMKKIMELLDSKDKVKAAKQLELLIAQEVELPREYYFSAIKFKTGDEAIALRWKYTKKLPSGKSTESIRSIMHIFGKGDKAIWVQDFDKDSIIKLPDDVKKLIESILDIFEAEKTDDPAIFKVTGEKKEREEKKKDDEDKDEDKKDEENDDEKKDKDKDKDDDSEEDQDEDDSLSIDDLK